MKHNTSHSDKDKHFFFFGDIQKIVLSPSFPTNIDINIKEPLKNDSKIKDKCLKTVYDIDACVCNMNCFH